MRLSELFTKTSHNVPADETSRNAQLLIQAGFIHKEMAGVYAFLPLGKIVLENIVSIIRNEMNQLGGQEISLTALQGSEAWLASGRWSDDVMDVWFRTELSNGTMLGLAPTHEEPLTMMMRRFISSYKDLPAYPYQFQTKFRNELRSKSGLMRGREFLMKDLYSFSADQKSHEAFYEKCSKSYLRIFDRLGLGDSTYKTFASGGSFSKFSHEFQTVSEVGEDTIYVHKAKKIAINKEVLLPEVLADLDIDRKDLVEMTAVEVGNIFTLGTKYSEALDLNYTDESGQLHPVFMGSYGIGPSRLMGLIAEHFADEHGLIWPDNVAPARCTIIRLSSSDLAISQAEELYDRLTALGVGVLYDDRELRAGEKFTDVDLMGIPKRLVISDKTLATETVEIKDRRSDKVNNVRLDEVVKSLATER